MARLICGKLAVNPKKQGEIAAIAEKYKANTRRIKAARRSAATLIKQLKIH
jgi:hypothetical protein